MTFRSSFLSSSWIILFSLFSFSSWFSFLSSILLSSFLSWIFICLINSSFSFIFSLLLSSFIPLSLILLNSSLLNLLIFKSVLLLSLLILAKFSLKNFWLRDKLKSTLSTVLSPKYSFLKLSIVGLTLNLTCFFFLCFNFSFQFKLCFSKSSLIIFFPEILFSFLFLFELKTKVAFLDNTSYLISSFWIFT